MKQKQLLFLLALLMTAATGAWAQTGMTKGSFSVSATKRVHFSKGNLQLVGENTFQFAENQWDYFGINQSDNHRDLFCWGTGNTPNQTTGNNTFTDWGDNTYLQATLGKGWRTLTKDEFTYVFNTRASGSSVFDNADGRYTTATINTGGTGVKGIILFPDGITIAASEVTSPGTINGTGTMTQCTTAQWAALAEKGCVFLPAGGFFLSGGAYGYGDITDYWSSTAADASKAYNLGFNSAVPGAVVNTAGTLAYNYGCSVRLVIDEYVLTLADGTQDADKWTASTDGTNFGALPIGGLKGDGKETVTLQYNGRLKVKNVTATSDAAPPSWKLTLSSPAKDLCIIANGGVIAQQTLDVASTEFTVEMPELTSQTVNIFATDGSGNCWYCTQENMSFAIGQTYQSSPTMTALDEDNSKPLYKITGTSDVTIPDGKTVVLSGVNISGGSITCDGSVTMILMGANTVTATSSNAAIKIGGPGTTLTITGSGSLTAQGGKEAAGIGTDRNEDGELSFGNIVINGGTVTATGGKEGAGIGTGLAQGEYASTSITCGDITINGGTVTAIGGLYGAGIGTGPTMSNGGSASITCGDITINGGTVTATGGDYGPGIGTGVFQKWGSETTSNRCGNITIGAGVTSVTATKGSGSPNSIGKGYAYGGTQNYGTITIGGTIYWDGSAYQNGGNPYLVNNITYIPSN